MASKQSLTRAKSLTSPQSFDVLAALQAYIGENWESHYGSVFARLLQSRGDHTPAGWMWNWPAAFFPVWFLYRRLYLAFFSFLLAFTVINVTDQAVAGSREGGSSVAVLFLAQMLVMGVFGDRLLFRKAYSKVTSAKVQTSPARLAAIGRPHKWLIWLAVVVLVIGILAAILIPALAQYGATHPVTRRELPTERRAQVISQAESAVPNKAPHLTVVVSSQSAEGVEQADMSQAFLEKLEAYTVERARKKSEEYLASTGDVDMKVNWRSEANYLESGGMKLAVIRVKTHTEFNSVFILGIVGTELKRVLCAIEVDQAVAISYGECGNAIKRTFGVDLAASR